MKCVIRTPSFLRTPVSVIHFHLGKVGAYTAIGHAMVGHTACLGMYDRKDIWKNWNRTLESNKKS